MIALLGLFEQFPLTSVLSDYNDKQGQPQSDPGKKRTLPKSQQEADSSCLYFCFETSLSPCVSRLHLHDSI